MTYQSDFTLSSEILKQIADQGFDFLPELIRIVINAAMQAKWQQYLKVAPYQHSPDRRGHANGYKPKTIKSRLGEITLDVPRWVKVAFTRVSWREASAASEHLP